MNGVARRINRMLDDLEPVIKATVPQLTRTLRAADEMVEPMSGPIERVAPGLTRLAETLSSPVADVVPARPRAVRRDVRRRRAADAAARSARRDRRRLLRRHEPVDRVPQRDGGREPPVAPRRARTPRRRDAVIDVDADDDDEPRAPPAQEGAGEEARSARKAPAKKSRRSRRSVTARRDRALTLAPATRPLTSWRRTARGRRGRRARCRGRRSVTSVPTSMSGGRNASAMPCSSTGE